MPNKNKIIDPLPESFASEWEAGEFWDTHSSEDYAEHFVPVEMEFKIEKRTYEVQVSEDVFERLQEKAASSHQPMRKVLDRILRKELAAV
jgi:predicted DNA binding CopG/RHH family protein